MTTVKENPEATNYRGFWRVTVWACLFCVIFFGCQQFQYLSITFPRGINAPLHHYR